MKSIFLVNIVAFLCLFLATNCQTEKLNQYTLILKNQTAANVIISGYDINENNPQSRVSKSFEYNIAAGKDYTRVGSDEGSFAPFPFEDSVNVIFDNKFILVQPAMDSVKTVFGISNYLMEKTGKRSFTYTYQITEEDRGKAKPL